MHFLAISEFKILTMIRGDVAGIGIISEIYLENFGAYISLEPDT